MLVLDALRQVLPRTLADGIARLLAVLQRLVATGHSAIVVEHNLELVQAANWVIDLGPKDGAGGGRLLAEGPPEQIALAPASHTGRALRDLARRTAPRATSQRRSG
jgi:excinuclease ABC subunit A